MCINCDIKVAKNLPLPLLLALIAEAMEEYAAKPTDKNRANLHHFFKIGYISTIDMDEKSIADELQKAMQWQDLNPMHKHIQQ